MKIKPSEQPNSKPKCFSYIRYSSTRQSLGTSQDRQLEIAPRIAAQKGWQLVDEFSMSDLGVSASKGDNVATLQNIIEKANSGVIPKGTILILESFDRYTRLIVDDAYQLIRQMLKAGIELYIDKSNRHLTVADLNNPMSIMMTVCELDASFQYTDLLKKRVKESWQHKRNNGTNGKLTKFGKLTKCCPAWINPSDHTINKEKAAIVKRIYDLYLSGMGVTAIAKQMNIEKVKPFKYGKFWQTCYVTKLLTNPLVIGDFQYKVVDGNKRIPVGETIHNYYPAVIDKNTFYSAVNKHKNAFKHRARNRGRTANLFAGIATCAVCGAPMNKINGNTVREYIGCRDSIMKHGCKSPLMSYNAMENAFLNIIFSTDALFQKKTSAVDATSINGQIETLQKQIDNITNAVLAGSATKALVAKQAELEKQIESLQLDLKIATTTSQEFDLEKYAALKNDMPNFKTNYEFRAKIHDYILNNFQSLTVDTAMKTYVITNNSGNVVKVMLSNDYKSYMINDEFTYVG